MIHATPYKMSIVFDRFVPLYGYTELITVTKI
jgi:hypothetical protein